MLDHLDDIASDMSVFHRVDDIHSMDGPRFFTLVARLPAYPGVMQVRVQAELAEDQPAPTAPRYEPEAAASGVPPELNAGFRGDGREFPPVFQNLTLKGGGRDG